jgi:hypothetical protein
MSDIIASVAYELDAKIHIYIKMLSKFGITHVEHGIKKKGYPLSLVNSHAQWNQLYKDKQLFKIDPIRRYAMMTPFEAISWEFMDLKSSQEAYALAARKKRCSVSRGILISLKTSKIHETFVFGSNNDQFNFFQVYQDHHRDVLFLMNAIGKLHKSRRHYPKLSKEIQLAA